MPRPGRPLSAKGVLSFEEPGWIVPDALVLDTTVVVDALLPSEPAHEACSAFLTELSDANATVVFSRLLEIELYEALFNLALKEQHGRRWRVARYDGRARRRAGRLLEKGRIAWQDLLDLLDWSCIELDQASAVVPDLMRRHGLRSYDAVHAATCFAVGLKDIATLDHGFALVPKADLTMHTTSARLASMQARR